MVLLILEKSGKIVSNEMDQNGCPEGMARDLAFMLHSEISLDCTVPVAAYYALVGIIVLAKVSIAIIMFRAWYARRARYLKSNDPKKIARVKNRLPIIPLNVGVSSLAYIALYVTLATNQSNTLNGASYALYGFGWTLCVALILIYLPKVVELATKLAPFALRDSAGKLRILTSFQRFLVAIAVVGLAAQAVILILFVPIFPDEPDLIRAGIASQTFAVAAFGIVLTVQIERAIEMVKRMSIPTEDSMDAAAFRSNRDLVGNVMWKLRLQQFILVAVSFPIVIINFLQVAMVLSTNWYFFFVMMCADVFINFGFLLTTTRSFGANQTSGNRISERRSYRSSRMPAVNVDVTGAPPSQTDAIVVEVETSNY